MILKIEEHTSIRKGMKTLTVRWCSVVGHHAIVHCPKNNLNFRIKTKPVTAGKGASAIVLYMSGF